MIAFDTTRAGMLAEIGATLALLASASRDERGEDAFDSPEVRIVLQKHEPKDLLPGLNLLLERRFAEVPREDLERDVLSPLKKAVGNAYKRGNLCDAQKWITVELVLTRAGAYIEVADEGVGFDVEGTLARLRAGETYFAHHGSGMRRFKKARSVIAFDRGGSTLRLRFLRGAPQGGESAVPPVG